MVVVTVDDAVKATDRFGQRYVFSWRVRKHLGNKERLRQEFLNLASADHCLLVILGKLVHSQDRDDVLQLLVALQYCLDATRTVVMFLTDDVRVENTRGRVERVNGGVDAQLGNISRQYECRVQMRERSRRRRIGQVICRDIDSLERGNRASLRRCNALLEDAHFLGQRRLVSHGRRHAAQQCRNFRSSQCVTVNVVDEH